MIWKFLTIYGYFLRVFARCTFFFLKDFSSTGLVCCFVEKGSKKTLLEGLKPGFELLA